MKYRYTLEKRSKKHICPDCGKKSFVRYVDTETNELIPEKYGRCDRENNCAYHLNPYSDGFTKNVIDNSYFIPNRIHNNPVTASSFIPSDVLRMTLKGYENNIFIQNLINNIPFPFDQKTIEKVVSLYYLGTISKGYRAGANTFPFIDINGGVRAVQVKQFDETNHTTATDSLTSIVENHFTRNSKPLPQWIQEQNRCEKKFSCLFGEHLLKKYPENPVALVEAPKTAIYGALYFGFPDNLKNFIWLAVYNQSSFTIDRLRVLKGKTVYVFPDLSKDSKTFNQWRQKANEIENVLPGTRFIFSDLLEKLANETDKENGKDLADYLINMDWKQFRNNSQVLTH